MSEDSEYYTPTIDEFILGFEFESNFWLFSGDGEWTKAKITQGIIDDFKCLYVADAYPSEFRKLKK